VLPLSATFVGMLFNLRIWLPFFSLAHLFSMCVLKKILSNWEL
jgi:hypothetical protein